MQATGQRSSGILLVTLELREAVTDSCQGLLDAGLSAKLDGQWQDIHAASGDRPFGWRFPG
ncbi:hypothetical protein GCM10017624_41690 [Azotobacter vinelandii]|nr:hypothetical protein GCM10017624_41690 [Azotobacter vinelandii]